MRGGETAAAASGQFCEKKLRWQRTVAAPATRGGMCVVAGLSEEKEGNRALKLSSNVLL